MKQSLRARTHPCASSRRTPQAPARTSLRLVLSLLTLAAVAFALGHAAPASASTVSPWVTAQNGQFVDTRTGNPVLLRGFDVVVGPSNLYQKAANLGANFARLTVTWEQMEPDAPVGGVHTYDPAYLAALDQQVSWYEDHNVNVLIDLHQSGWSSYFSPITDSARGEPPWLYEGKYAVDQKGLGQAKADFVTDPQIAAWYRDLLTMLVNRYSQYANVVGYEIYNEPQGGALGNDQQATQTLVDWQAGMARHIASLDPERTIFFQTRAGANYGLETIDLSGFAGFPHVALDLHDYYNGVGGLNAEAEDWYPSWDETHNQSTANYQGTIESQEHILVRVLNAAHQHGWGLIVGEWGTTTTDPNILVYQAQMLTVFARYQVSWTRWVLTTSGTMAVLNGDGTPSPAGVQLQQALTTTPSGLLSQSLPQATGAVGFGSTLTASNGTWTGQVDTVSYQWLRCDDPGSRCVAIPGATGPTYTVGNDDAESRLRVDVDVTGPDGASSAVSAATVAAPALAPQSTGAPQVTGVQQLGEVLTSDKGVWAGTITKYAYQWLQCDGDGSNCSPIDSATKPTYTAKLVDVGHALVSRVTATGPGGTTDADSAPTVPIAPIAIVNTQAPRVTGSTVVGNKLTADKGTWSGTVSSYAYQWLSCDADGTGCTQISGATNSGYTTKTADIGHAFAVRVTATGPDSTVNAVSPATGAITAVSIRNTQAPKITGSTVVGNKLTADKGTWSGTISGYSLQWLSCAADGTGCTPISGATNNGYTTKTADIGHAFAVRVTATGPGGTANAVSPATAAITAVSIRNTGLPTISGQAVIGQQLTLGKGTWVGTISDYAYQWLQCNADGTGCMPISGATKSTYTSTVADFDHAIAVRVTATGPGGSAGAMSASTAAIASATLGTLTSPSLTGTARAGSQLAADKGTWKGTITSYAYQWLRCDAGGGNCTPLAGKTSTKYALTDADVGHAVRVAVTATGPGGSLTANSAATAKVADLAPSNTSRPVLNGTPLLGHGNSLSIGIGAWNGSNLTYTYRWERCDSAGSNCVDMGLTTKSYKLQTSDQNTRIRAYVEATNSAGAVEVSTVLTPVIVFG